MNFKNRLITAIATGAVLVSALAPLASADTITVSGNGENSTSNVNLGTNTTTQVNQSNSADIKNHVDSSSSTGGNSSNGNTGGNTSITTGNATSNTTVTTAANLNQANLNCGCSNGSTDVNITGNGEGSKNTAGVKDTNAVYVNQTNNADIHNDVNADARTGGNDATSNTGGNTTIHTGDASTNVSVGTAANANVALVGNGGGNAGGSSITISDNGEHSFNGVALDQTSAVILNQKNNAKVDNDVKADAGTGHNTANGNTHGDVAITTGSATTGVEVDNAANFNAADLNCDCVTNGLGVDISKNGENSMNTVGADTNSLIAPSQANSQGFWNDVFGNGKTGGNTTISNTGGNMGPSGVTTGDGNSNTDVNNAGNVNSLGNVSVDGWTFGTTFDFGQLLSFLGSFGA